MPDLATALKKQAPTASLAVPSTCASIWPLCIFTPSRFKTGWVISVCPLFFLIQGWWESCPSGCLCAAQELDVLRSAWFTAASTSLHQYYWAVFAFHPHQFSVWNDFFFPSLRNIVSLQVINVHTSVIENATWLFTNIQQLMSNWKHEISGPKVRSLWDFRTVPHFLVESVLLCQILVIFGSGGSSVSDLL